MNTQELQSRLKNVAYRVVTLCESLPKKKICGFIENQVLRSSFSAPANYRAATKAQSKKAFVAKLSIAFEEIDETLFWIEVIQELKLIKPNLLESLLKEVNELCAILASARKTSQASMKKNIKS